MEEITLITGNEAKADEFSRLLGMTVLHQKLSLPEPQETDVAVVAKAKAEAAFETINQPLFVDDTGLYINAWGELPGALIVWFLDNVGNEGLVKMLAGWSDRSARVVTALGYCDHNGSQVFVGEVAGNIAEKPKGDNGFGYDAIFIPDGQNKTFAEMDAIEKDQYSMRALATQVMKKVLKLS